MSKSDLPSQNESMKKIATFVPDGAGIAIQEAAGQNEVINMDILPKDVRAFVPGDDPDAVYSPKNLYARLGIEITGDADDLFWTVKLPVGWSKEAHPVGSLGSYVLDELGRRRILVFYKAAWYDRHAHAHIEARYFWTREWDDATDNYRPMVIITDAGKEIRRFDVKVWDGETIYDALSSHAEAYLDGMYPNWRNPFAYWNDKQGRTDR